MRAASAHRYRRSLGRGAAILAAALLLYPLLAYASWLVPANRGWHAPPSGPRVYVMSNGVHTGIAMPLAAPLWDWRPMLHLRARAAAWVWLGWEQRDFYLETPTWADVRLRTVLAAATGSDRVLLHVDVMPAPRPDADARALTLTRAQYRRLAGTIAASLAPGARPMRGYGTDDFFYPALGRYSARHTCNAWTGEVLRAAGVRVGRWTPTAGSVMVGF